MNNKITVLLTLILEGLLNHSDQKFSVDVGQRIAQMVFLESFEVKFVKRDLLSSSDRQEGGLGSTGSF